MTTLRYFGYDIMRAPAGWTFAHVNYDGPEDERCGNGDTIKDCQEQINEIEAERLRRNLTWTPKPPHTFDIATVAAMARYPLNPGDSDLDDEQPVSLRLDDRFVRVTLGDIREAHTLLPGWSTRP